MEPLMVEDTHVGEKDSGMRRVQFSELGGPRS
jgi:hypothetical protein